MKDFLRETILQAGEGIMGYFGHATILHTKEKVVDIVTNADLASNKLICDAIKARYPDHGIITEEASAHQESADYVWYVDPLDGTKNFATHVPLFGINMALARRGELILAAIYLPATRELAIAEKGQGAFIGLDGAERRMLCSVKTNWEGAYGIGPIRFSPQGIKLGERISELSQGTAWCSAIASPAISGVWMADGRRDWYTTPGKNSWDFAAPCLIAKEAGCEVLNFAGTDWQLGDKGVIMTNTHLVSDLVAAVRTAYVSSSE